MNPVQNQLEKPGFFRPINRLGGDSKRILNFCDRFLSFGSTQWSVTYQETQGKKRVYEITDRQLPIQYLYFSTLTKIALIAVGFWKFKGPTLSLLLGAFLSKCWLRTHEAFNSRKQTPLLPQSKLLAGNTQKEASHQMWINQSTCVGLFPLFAMGLKVDAEDDNWVALYIGENMRLFSKSFLSEIPFFSAALRSQMSETQEPGTLRLSKESLPFNLDELANIQEKFFNPISNGWSLKEKEIFGFLCLEPPGKIQVFSKDLLSKNPELSAGQQTCPSAKVTSPGYTFFSKSSNNDLPSISTPHDNLIPFKKAFMARSREIIEDKGLPPYKKHYYINELVSNFIAELGRAAGLANQIIPNLLEAIEELSSINKFINILEFPQTTDYAKLGELLEKLPYLFWLKAGFWDTNFLPVDTFPLSPSLKVVSFEESFSPNQIATLNEKMPYLILADISEKREDSR